jgi:hypothetical protein
MSCRGYIVAEQGMQSQLPNAAWTAARLRVNKLFQSLGGMAAVYVQTLPRPRATDGVVQVCSSKADASFCFRMNVQNQLNALFETYPDARKLLRRFSQPSHYSVDAGRSYVLKTMWRFSVYRPTLVVATFGVVRLDSALAAWTGLLSGKPKATAETVRNAGPAEQKRLGTVLGNLIAHELRHQLAPSKDGTGLRHSPTGLGKDGANFADPKIDFTDGGAILASVAKLQALEQEAYRSML